MADDAAKAQGNAAFSSRDFTSAVIHYTSAISLSPTNHILFSNRSAAYASLRNYADALSDAIKTVELKPDWAKGYSRLGAAHWGLKQFQEAAAAYTKGLEIDPSNAATHLDYGTVLPLQASLAQELEAVQIDPDNTTAQANLAADYLDMGDYRQALAPAMAVIKLDPQTDPYWYLKDPTLRRGDIVVTAGGVLVYQGRDSDASRPADFVALGGSDPKGWKQKLQTAAAGGRTMFHSEPTKTETVTAEAGENDRPETTH